MSQRTGHASLPIAFGLTLRRSRRAVFVLPISGIIALAAYPRRAAAESSVVGDDLQAQLETALGVPLATGQSGVRPLTDLTTGPVQPTTVQVHIGKEAVAPVLIPPVCNYLYVLPNRLPGWLLVALDLQGAYVVPGVGAAIGPLDVFNVSVPFGFYFFKVYSLAGCANILGQDYGWVPLGGGLNWVFNQRMVANTGPFTFSYPLIGPNWRLVFAASPAAADGGANDGGPSSMFLAVDNGGDAFCDQSFDLASGTCPGNSIPPAEVSFTTAGMNSDDIPAVAVVGSKAALGPAVFFASDGGELGGDAGATPDTGGSPACNQDPNIDCDPTFEPNSGASYDTAISTSAGSYTFNGWRDVLRVLLAGMDQNAGSDITKRDCNSPVRQALANSWGKFFENDCQASQGEWPGRTSCTALRHIFRPDDFSTATDTLTALLGLPNVITPGTTVTVTSAAADGGIVSSSIVQNTGASPFCNAVRPSFAYPTKDASGNLIAQPRCLQGSDAVWDPTTLCPAAGPATCATWSGTTDGCTRERGVFRSTMQDNDPIRRSCVGTGALNPSEDVCSHSRDLGLVLPMNDEPEPNTGNAAGVAADRYNNTFGCQTGGFAAGPLPNMYDATTQQTITVAAARGVGLCPNGDTLDNTGACHEPVQNAAGGGNPGNPQCMSTRAIGLLTISTTAVPVIHPVSPVSNDGRSWNQHLFFFNAATQAAVYQTNGFSTPLPMTGAYYRLHVNHTMNVNTLRTCAQADMTDQIGCLVEASPCGLGVASPGAVANAAANGNFNTEAIKVNAQNPLSLCIEGGNDGGVPPSTYPL
jgi:hypothetical protein